MTDRGRGHGIKLRLALARPRRRQAGPAVIATAGPAAVLTWAAEVRAAPRPGAA
jgi:hypothetical protein